MGFLADKVGGGTVRVSVYTGGGGKGPQFVDSSGNVWDESRAQGGLLADTGVDVSAALYDSAGDPVSAGGGVLIGEHLLAADAAALTLSGLSLAAWTQVRAVIQARSVLGTDGAGDYTRNFLRFNSDAGANYLWATENDDANSVNQTAGGYVNGIIAAHGTGPDEEAGIFGICFADIMYPGVTDRYKNVYTYGVMSYLTTSLSTHGGGIWKNNAAITRMDVVANDGGNFLAGSRLALIGIA